MSHYHSKYNIRKDAVITIAGTVGVGKSTLTKSLANALQFNTSLEKVDGNPYLESFYRDFSRWSFHLQIYFLAERFKEQKRIFNEGGGYIQDRSIYEDTAIFAKMLHDQGHMSDTDFETYTSLFDAMVMTPYFPHPHLLVYIDGNFDDIVDRIQLRGRPMEQETPIAYWEDLYERYESWIHSFTACPVLKINMNEYDLVKDPQSIDIILERVESMLNKQSAVTIK